MPTKIPLPTDEIVRFCQHNPILKLSLFGSVLRDDFRDQNSDIDMLVELEPDAGVGLFKMARMERELSQIVGRKVDLRTPAELSKYFRDQVVASSELLYAASR